MYLKIKKNISHQDPAWIVFNTSYLFVLFTHYDLV